MSDLTPKPQPGFNWRLWGTLVLFVLILVVGVAAGAIDRSAAKHWGQRLAWPNRDQRLAALDRLARLDHLAFLARRSLINALDDNRLPAGAVAAKRMLTALLPSVVSGRIIDLSVESVAGRAAAILWVVVPLDYAGFYAEVTRQRATVRRRAARLLGQLGALQPAKSGKSIDVLAELDRDPDPGVRRAAFQGLKKIMDQLISTGTISLHGDRCRLALGEALIGADPHLAVETAQFLLTLGYPDNMVHMTLGYAWLAVKGQVTRRR